MDDLPPARPGSAEEWDLPSHDERQRGAELARALGLPRLAGEILLRRGFEDPESAQAWIDAGEDELEDFDRLPDLPAAVGRILRAIEDGERIVVHGDYDADGICGTALLTRGLRRLGAVVEPFVPDRQRDGYGVAPRLVEHAAKTDVAVLITVDTGSSAHEELESARDAGIEVIVCDHHLFDQRPAGATYFINPQRPDSRYPHRDLCGSGVAYQLLRATARARGGDAHDEIALAALATIADQVPLRGENRVLVRRGLQEMGRTAILGLQALLEVSRCGRGRVQADDIAFQVAPRINAPGRIERARTAVDLLLATDAASSRKLAARLDALNRERKTLDQECAADALQAAARCIETSDPAGLVLASPNWHRGVVGIAAARVVQAHRRPALLLAIEGDQAVGSARSVPGVDVKRVLDECAELMIRYGGHAAAAGATVATSQVEALAGRFATAVSAVVDRPASAVLRVDGIVGATDFDDAFARFLDAFGPFGNSHQGPRLAGLSLGHATTPRVVGNGHLRLDLDLDGQRRNFVGFGRADAWLPVAMASPLLDVAFAVRYRPDSNYDVWELTLSGLRDAQSESQDPLEAEDHG